MESTITLSDAKARFSEIVERAVNGEEFVVTRMGKAAVQISRCEGRKRHRRIGDLAGQIWIAEDFDEWPPELQQAFGMDVHTGGHAGPRTGREHARGRAAARAFWGEGVSPSRAARRVR